MTFVEWATGGDAQPHRQLDETGRCVGVVFWQSARTRKQARPNVTVPTARASGHDQLEILVDSHERYAWKFTQQQVTTTKRALPAGDYAIEIDGAVIASVERKSLADLVSTMTGGKLWFLLADLAALEHGAVVVEDRYSSVFKYQHVRPSVIAEGLAEAAARYPSVPIMFCETRPLAQEWAYRFLGAALTQHDHTAGGGLLVDQLPTTDDAVPAPAPSTAEVRQWATAHGLNVSDRGRLRPEIWDAYHTAQQANGDG